MYFQNFGEMIRALGLRHRGEKLRTRWITKDKWTEVLESLTLRELINNGYLNQIEFVVG